MAEVKVYTPATITGLFSNYAEAVIGVGKGMFKALQNVRWADTGLLTLRQQIESRGSIASGTPRGIKGFFFNGTYTLFGSVYATGKTTVWKSTDGGANWTQITASSGQYGDTRLDYDGTNDYPTAFEVVYDPVSEKDVLIAQNGFDYPFVYNGTIGAKHRDISLPNNTGGMRTRLTWGAGLTVRDGTSTTLADDNAAARFFLADTSGASTTANKLNLTMSAATSGDDCSVTFSATADFTNARMVYIVVSADAISLKEFVSGVRVAAVISGSATTKVLYDPSSATYQRPEQVEAEGGSTQYSVLGYHVPADWHSAAVDRITFEWVSSKAATAGGLVTIVAICGSNTNSVQYAVKGGCEHAVSYYNSGTFAESPPIALPVETQLMTEVSATFEPDLRLPNEPSLYYTATIYYKNTTATERDRGVDRLNVYRREFGESIGVFTVNATIAAHAGSWAFSSGTAESQLSLTEAKETSQRNYRRVEPSAYVLPIPVARAMVNANGRLVCGGRGGDKADSPRMDSFRRIMASDFRTPFRFAEVPDTFDPFSAGYGDLPSGESCMALKAVGSDGSSSVYIVTNAAVHVAATHSPGTSLFLTRVLGVGTCSGPSVVEQRGVIYFVDTDGRVQRITGGRAEVISIPVDDVFQAVPSTRRGSITAAYFRDRIYFALTPTGGTLNTRILVFAESRDAWESLDTLGLSKDAAFMYAVPVASGTHDSPAGSTLYFLSSDTTANCCRYESASGTEDATSPISFTLTSGDLMASRDASGETGRITYKWGSILCAGNTGTLTVSTSYKRGTNGSNTITLSNSTAFDWADVKLTTADGNAPHASISFSGALGAGTAIRELAAWVDERPGAGRTE